MEEYNTEVLRIKELLRSHPSGLSISEISDTLDMNRNSVAKYLSILQVQGSADGRKMGTSKIFFLSERLAASSIRKICTEPYVLLNQDGRIVESGPRFFDLFRLPPDRLIGQPFDPLPGLAYLDGGGGPQFFRSALRGSEQRVRGRIQDGTGARPAMVQFLPLVFENGKPGVCIIVEGTTVEGAPIQERDGGADAFMPLDNLVEYVVRQSAEGIIQYVNEPYCRALGKMRDDLIGHPFKPLVSPEDAARIRTHLSRLSVQYPVGMIEFRTVISSGEPRYQRWWDRALFSSRGELEGYLSCGIDITELHETNQKLKKTTETLEETITSRTNELREINRHLYTEMTEREKAEAQLRHTQFVMDNAADMVVWVTRNARLQYTNQAAVQASGYDRQELLGLSVGDLFPDYSLPEWDSVWERLRSEGTITRSTCLTRRDRSTVPVEIVVKYMEYHGTSFACCFSRDISERTRMEHALQLANKKLNALSSIARHEIQNNITVLLGYLARSKKMEKDRDILSYLDRQEKAARAISREIGLTRDFKDLGMEPPEWQDVNGILRKEAAPLQEGPVQVAIDLPTLEVFADRQLSRAFFRIFEYMTRPDRQLSAIRISSGKTGNSLSLVIEDDGPSVPQTEKTQIFDMQSDQSGIPGLFVTREILSLTDITVAENGEEGRGVRFEITIPETSYRILLPPIPQA